MSSWLLSNRTFDRHFLYHKEMTKGEIDYRRDYLQQDLFFLPLLEISTESGVVLLCCVCCDWNFSISFLDSLSNSSSIPTITIRRRRTTKGDTFVILCRSFL